MRTGRIKWFNVHESYGYIVLFDGTEVYFHSTGLLTGSELNPGTDVSFDIMETKTGAEAHNIDIIG